MGTAYSAKTAHRVARIALLGACTVIAVPLAEAQGSHLCGVTRVMPKSNGGYDVYFDHLSFVSGVGGSYRVFDPGLTQGPYGHQLYTAYPAKPGDTVITANSAEDSCELRITANGVEAHAAYHPPLGGEPAKDVTVQVPAVAGPQYFPQSGYVCWLKGVAKTPWGYDLYFTGDRMVQGPAGALEVNSDPQPLLPAYPAKLGDTFQLPGGLVQCSMAIVSQDRRTGLWIQRIFRRHYDADVVRSEFIAAN
jgi:hypothetical protein